MERFNRRLALLEHHQRCEERYENTGAKKDQCPSSGEHAPPKERPGDEPDEACPPSTPPPSREDEPLTEESLLSNHSESDPDYKPPPSSPSSPSSSEDEVLTVKSQLSRHSAPEKHHSRSSSSKTEIGEAEDQEAKDGHKPDSSASSAVGKPKRITTIRHEDGDDEDSGDSEQDEKDRKRRVERGKKAVTKQKRQQDDDDWDGEDRQITATRPTKKGRKKTAVTRQRSDGDAPEMEVKKQRNRRWTEQERAAVKRHLGKFIKRKTLPKKKDCLMCIGKESSVLRERTWRHVKYFVNNEIRKIKAKKRKLEDERERG